MRQSLLPILSAILLAPCVVNAQTARIVDGEVGTGLTLSRHDLRAMHHQRIEVEDQGTRTTYQGVPLTEILRRAGVTIGRAPLQGSKALISTLLVRAFDGFQAVFARWVRNVVRITVSGRGAEALSIQIEPPPQNREQHLQFRGDARTFRQESCRGREATARAAGS